MGDRCFIRRHRKKWADDVGGELWGEGEMRKRVKE